MSEAKLGTGFRFGKIVAWTPAIVLVIGILLVARGEMAIGAAVAVFSLMLWVLVRSRRKKADAEVGQGTATGV